MFRDTFDFEPPVHPGEILREDYLPVLGLTCSQLAERAGISVTALTDIVNERTGVTPDIASRLGTALGLGARYWIGLQNQFDRWSLGFGKQA